jgi:small subunit ribosomal protein S6
MRIYESTFILSPQADDAAFDRQIKAITDLIERNNGKTVKEDRWGVRRLAFPIKKFTQGFYTRIIFEGNSQVLSELERFYKLEEPYIRYLTVLFEGSLEDRVFEGRIPHESDTPAIPHFSTVDDGDDDLDIPYADAREKKPFHRPRTAERKTEEVPYDDEVDSSADSDDSEDSDK